MGIGIAELTALGGAPATGDRLAIVDVSDPTQAPAGTTKYVTVAEMFTSPAISGPTISGTGTFATGTITANTPAISVTQTWNNAAVAFTAVKVNVTNTASDASSMLLDLEVGGVTLVKVDRAGLLTAQSITSGLTTVASVLFSGTGSSFAAGKMYLNATNGLTIVAKTGSANDMVWLDNAGNIAVQMPVGTKNLETEGSVTVGKSAATNLVVAGGGAQLATNATVGFLMVSSCSGNPTGTPASIPTGTVPLVMDSTNGRLYAYYSAGWHFAAFT